MAFKTVTSVQDTCKRPWTTELRNSPYVDLEFKDSSDTIAVYSWQQQCQNYC